MGINSLKKILNSECHNKIVNLPYFSKIPRLYKSAMEKSDKDKFNILVLSRLVDYKGVDIVVEAVKKLNSQNVKLYIGGVGELAETLKRKSLELNIQDQVVFCGFLNENEMIELQNKCHVFVHAAKKHEPYGLVVIDNLSMGIPVIATNVTGAAIDRIKDGFNGFIIEPNDVNSLVHKLEYLMKNQTMLIEMSANARVGAEQWTAERGVSIIENSLINSL
ncbi:MAG TPA: glycosyltransferase [Saprospiraceae bacterium]|nr:glycosyltransferase [Saprospiraceae bacterium]